MSPKQSSLTFPFITNTLEDDNKPFVAAVHRLALWGEVEATMGCHTPIVSPQDFLTMFDIVETCKARFRTLHMLNKISSLFGSA
ncbi:hypothetical protein HanIR_Chr02g0080701 [Helianthus annuus]|nr:hypothetical protein HanIR_Chr02g0080701 [Helianthus annuus]